MTATLRALWREAQIAYYELALQSLCSRDPAHPDVPEVILEINRLVSERIDHAATN